MRLERNEIADRLAEADELDRDGELGLDGEDDAALGRAVELGQHDAGDLRCVAELACLGEAVLTRGGVDDESTCSFVTASAFSGKRRTDSADHLRSCKSRKINEIHFSNMWVEGCCLLTNTQY